MALQGQLNETFLSKSPSYNHNLFDVCQNLFHNRSPNPRSNLEASWIKIIILVDAIAQEFEVPVSQRSLEIMIKVL